MRRDRAYAILARMLAASPQGAPAARDWPLLAEVATGSLVAPALYPAFERAAALATLPADVAQYLGTLTELNARRNALLREHLGALLAHCAAAGVRPALLKGAALLVTGVYGDGERVLGDLDLLVPAEHVGRLRDRLAAAGYAELPSEAAREPSRHHLPARAHASYLGAVELHHAIVGHARGARLLDEVAGRLPRPWHALTLAGAHAERPDATLHVAHRFVHDMVHEPGYARGWLGLRGMLDVYRLARHEEIQWGLIAHSARVAGLAVEWQAWRHAVRQHFPIEGLAGRATAGARLWALRVRAHQRWPGLYGATRRVFRLVRGVVPLRWLRYWGW